MTISYRILFVFILLRIIGFSPSTNLAQSITFNHLTVENGLSNNKVNAIVQDRTGFIWFGTDDGLNRYDGYGFKVFRHDADNPNSLSDNSIWALFEDKRGNIWIGTKVGVLNKYDPVSEKFSHIEIKSSITENSIKKIFEDSRGNLWIGSYKEGLYRLDLSSNKIDHWKSNPNDEKSLSHNYVLAIVEDNNGNIIIGTYIGLNRFNPDLPENGFERFYNKPDDQNSLSSNLIWGLTKSELDPGIIWIGTSNHLTKFHTNEYTFEQVKISNPDNLQYGTGSDTVIEELIADEKIIWTDSYSGLVRLNLSSEEIDRFISDENNPKSLINNQINTILRDRTGVLWVATENGVSYFTPKSSLFNSLDFSHTNFNSSPTLNKKNITALNRTSDNKYWIGTADGLYSVEDMKNYQHLRKINEFDGLHIWSLTSLNENEIWVGTYGKGLKQFFYTNNETTSWDINSPKIQTEALYYNKSLLTDSRKNIWVGYWGVGTARINPQTGDADVWQNEPGNTKSLSHNDVWVIKEDRSGRIWIGTQGGGLNLFEDKSGGIFHHWLHTENEKSGLNSNNINSIYEASNSDNATDSITILWIGTSNGLNRVDVEKKSISDPYGIDLKFHSYTIKDGLSANNVNSILEDDEGNLWFGTGDGISFFDVTKETFTNFSSADGLNGTVMNPESALRLNNGLMLFGSTKGLNIFDPEKIKLSDYKPSIVITDFQIFNESVTMSEDSPLRKSILSSDEIILFPDQNVFSIEFAALDYNSPQSIEYAYKMEGFDRDWIYSSNRRFVTYTNLDPGEYMFIVKSTNADGVWNDKVTTLSIIINPPWWKTFWAYGLYVVLIFIGLIAIRRFELNRAKMRNELKLREFEVRKKTELESLKSRFFANLSHEFRTPLMLIKGPLEQLKSGKTDNNFAENIELIERNSNRLKVLIDQLLELSQLEKAAIPLKAKQENLITTLKGLVSSFDSLADQKNITLIFESELDSILAWIDRDKFEKIIDNLLSNAIKFTPSGGKVIVIAKEANIKGNRFCEIKISDSGIGIPKDKLEKIFNRFFQVDASTQRNYGGSGIGLALVKELVDLHKWNISVESEVQTGTEFKLMIPMWDYLDSEEKILTEPSSILSNVNNFTAGTEEINYPALGHKQQEELSGSNNKPSVLIVDDSEDVRKYLSNLLKENYTISEADNGESGIKVAMENLPDLIISDVMMPSMDGIEFCNRIKSEWQTSDIPVILLTAKASFESKIEGLEIGADDYLTKPFKSKELFVRLKNLLEQRKRLREKYSKDLNPISPTPLLNDADQEFINKAYGLIEENLDKINFNTENLAKELFLSRSQLHRKMLAITGQAPGEFIRTIKLKQAAKMLLEKKLSVTQVAYEIGFSSPAQFTRAFSKQFGCLPSEYSARNRD